MPKPTEVAELVVNGQRFRDWTSVEVQHRWTDAFHIFVFSCSELSPVALEWFQSQFKPGDSCQIFLAGILAMDGYIVTRQVAYDAPRHSVQLIGKSKTWDIARSSVKTENGKFDDYPWIAIANSCVAPFGVSVEIRGTLDSTPFKNVQVQPGETVFRFLERLARNRGIILGSTVNGNVIAVGDHSGQTTEALVEGENILRASCVITDQYIHNQYLVPGQMHGSDESWGRTVSRQLAEASGSAKRYSPLIVPTEQPGTIAELQKRVQFEAQWREGTEIDCQITVQGWVKSDGDLWRVGSYPLVRSPMLMLNMPLGVRNATFRQDDRSGTTTTLDLVAPWFLNGHVDLSAGNPPAPGPGRAVP